MGRKHTGNWKHLYLCITSLIIALCCFGCTALTNLERKVEARDHLYRGEKLLEQGNLELSLQEHKKALSLLGHMTPGDRVLFNMGIIYAHFGNPAMSYKKSLVCFRRLTKEFPQSPLVERAKIWIEVLAAVERKKVSYIKLSHTKKKEKKETPPEQIQEPDYLHLAKKLLDLGDFEGSLMENQKVLSLFPNTPPGDRALFNMALVYAHYNNPDRNYKKSTAYFKRLTEEFPKSALHEQAKIWIEVLETMEKAKQVDIEIEEKRKELTR